MDMWRPFINSVMKHVPGAEWKIAFDKFHVAQHLSRAVDQVRRKENRELREEGDDHLSGTRYLWLQNPENMTADSWRSFASLRESSLKAARAWAIKETAMQLWHYTRRGWAVRAWKEWLGWALRSQLDPIRRVANDRPHPPLGNRQCDRPDRGITNASSEGMNTKIQWVKRMARGFRNRERFRNAIYFHLGGLDLYPSR